MKRIVFILVALACILAFSSCSELAKKVKDKLTEKVETAKEKKKEKSDTENAIATEVSAKEKRKRRRSY